MRILLLLLLISMPVLGDSEAVLERIEIAKEVQEELQEEGFKVQRYNDTLHEIEQEFVAQVALEEANGTPSFVQIENKLDSLEELERAAFLARDELTILKQAINESTVPAQEAQNTYNEAFAAASAERYEEALELVEVAYEELSEAQALDVRAQAIYEASTRGLLQTIENNSKYLMFGGLALAVILIIMRKPVLRARYKKEIQICEKKKAAIRNLIAKTQEQYFTKNSLDENSYHIRTKKYAEMIRELNRQIPLLEEEIAKLDKVKK